MHGRGGQLGLRAGDERGFTLVELLVASAMSLVVVGALVVMLSSVLWNEPANADRNAQIQDARVMLERVVREVRQGKAVEGVAGIATQLTVDTWTHSGCNGGAPTSNAQPCRVTYGCTEAASGATCTRRAGTGSAVTVLSGLGSANVFSYGGTTSPTCNATTASAPRFVCIKLTYPTDDGSETVTVEDSAFLRNSTIP